MIKEAGFGGGCHWCTEAVFSSLKGVLTVKQGWIASYGENNSFSEGVWVEYDNTVISLELLIEVHLYTHSSTAMHSMRNKYRSAVYTFNDDDSAVALNAIKTLQPEFENPVITQVLPFAEFTTSRNELLDYYFSNPGKPFCELYISPKLKLIVNKFSIVADHNKLKHLNN